MLSKPDWVELIPHAGTMCLLDRVLAWNASTLHAVAESHAEGANPLRGAHGLHAVHLAEYAAQATAVHGALRARAQGEAAMRPGMLVSLRDAVLEVEYVDPAGGPLDVHVECLYADAAGSQYAYRVEQGGRPLGSGRVAVIHGAA